MSEYDKSGVRVMAGSKPRFVLTPEQHDLLTYLYGVEGADVWSRDQARIGRELEKLGLVRIVKARNAPADGAARQPYYGIKIKAAGTALLEKEAA